MKSLERNPPIRFDKLMAVKTDAEKPSSFRQRHFIAAIGIPCFTVFILLIGGAKFIDISLHEARTMATVTGLGSHGVILYSYEADGQKYSGPGDPGNPPYREGSTFEVRYSTMHPSFSVAHNPFTIFGQYGVGCLFLLWGDYMMSRNTNKRGT